MKAERYLQQLLRGEVASLAEILDAKEARVQLQQKLLLRGRSLLCFSLNIPGAIKRDPLFEQGYREGRERVLQRLKWQRCDILQQEERSSAAGYELYLVLDADPKIVKRWMVEIEEADDFGRLLDIDVLDKDGRKISRSDLGLPSRRCYLCHEAAAFCSRSQRHSYDALLLKIIEILQDTFLNQFLDQVASNSCRALLYEVATSPKPGLVDCRNSGSHQDMDLFTFLDSSAALTPYFRSFTKQGIELCEKPANEILLLLRYPGRRAEAAMLRVTGGVNCHKGLIFSMGILCCAMGIQYGQGKPYDSEGIFRLSAALCESLLDDFKEIKEAHSAGERLYLQYGITGIRGEAAQGYPTVQKIGLPAIKSYREQGMPLQEAGVWTLLKLLSETEDSNILSRSDMETLKQVQEEAKALLDRPDASLEDIANLDENLIQKNLSPGGCADLLALSYFLYFMEQK